MRLGFIGVILISYAPFSSGDDTAIFDNEVNVTVDHVRNMSGGYEAGNETLGSLDAIFSWDLNSSSRYYSGDYFVYILANRGGNPTEIVGDAQGTSNIEADDDARVYELWYRRPLGERSNVLVGLHDYNSAFSSLEYSALFLNSSFGIGPDIAQASPSIFPETSLGINYTLDTDRFYLLLGVYDGIAGDPKSPKGTNIRLYDGDGAFSAFELGFPLTKYKGKMALGLWYHTADIENPITGESIDSNVGTYFIMEANWSENDHAFVQLGIADESKNIYGQYLGAGIKWVDCLQPGDQLGLAVATVFSSSSYTELYPELKNHETAMELTYQFALGSAVTLQPDIQYIINPGFEYDNAWVASIRLSISLMELYK